MAIGNTTDDELSKQAQQMAAEELDPIYDDVYDTLEIAKNNIYNADDNKGFFELFGDFLFGSDITIGATNDGFADMESSVADDMIAEEDMEILTQLMTTLIQTTRIFQIQSLRLRALTRQTL